MRNPPAAARRGSSDQAIIRSSRNDVAMEADPEAHVVLILDRVEGSRLRGSGSRGVENRRAVRCRFDLLIKDIKADVEPRRDVPLAARTNSPPVEVLVASAVSHLRGGERDG